MFNYKEKGRMPLTNPSGMLNSLILKIPVLLSTWDGSACINKWN